MKRRNFLSLAALASAAAAMRPARARDAAGAADGADAALVDGDIDPYFLETGDLTDEEAEQIADFEGFLDVQSRGEDAVMPRGGRPRRTPTYRLVHWTGGMDDPDGRFQGPLSTRPAFEPQQAYRLNAQILGFNAGTREWKGKNNEGTLTVEMRARLQGEPLTWLYAEQFELFKGGGTTLGNEYVAQRNNLPDPVVTDEPTVDLRIQLIRHRKNGGIWKRILKGAAYLVSSFVGGGVVFDAVTAAVPSVRVPRLLQEGVALSQAMFGGIADERPMWRSGFNSYAMSTQGSRMRIRPGYWMAIDEHVVDLRDIRPVEMGDRVVLVRGSDGALLDANYLVFWVEIEAGQLSTAPPPVEPVEPESKGAPTPKGRG